MRRLLVVALVVLATPAHADPVVVPVPPALIQTASQNCGSPGSLLPPHYLCRWAECIAYDFPRLEPRRYAMVQRIQIWCDMGQDRNNTDLYMPGRAVKR